MACRQGLLRLATPQTKTCLWEPRTGGHFVTCKSLRVVLPLVAVKRA
jgi:hypothetical protein